MPGSAKSRRRTGFWKVSPSTVGAVASAAVVGFASAGYTTFRLLRTAADVQARYGDAVFVEPRPGAYLVALGLAFVLVGGLRLGRA